MNLYIYVNDCFLGLSNFASIKTSMKYLVKKIIFQRDSSGHIAVTSCIKALSESSDNIFINKIPKGTSDNYALVTGGIDILKAVLTKKRYFKKLVVGPNIVHNILEHNKILLDERIEALLVPSENARSYYANILSYENIKKNILIWPAFPTDLIKYDIKDKDDKLFFIIYIKDKDFKSLVIDIKNVLSTKKIKYICLEYGSYKKSDFYKNLKKASHMIFLGNAESQCIAQFEAYFYNVEMLILANRRYKSKLELQFIYPNYLGFASPYSDFLKSSIFYHNFELIDFLNKFEPKDKRKAPNKNNFNDRIFNLKEIITD